MNVDLWSSEYATLEGLLNATNFLNGGLENLEVDDDKTDAQDRPSQGNQSRPSQGGRKLRRQNSSEDLRETGDECDGYHTAGEAKLSHAVEADEWCFTADPHNDWAQLGSVSNDTKAQ